VSGRILRYALPVAGSQLVQFAGSLAALAVLGRIGTGALGAVAAPLALLGVCCAVFFGFTTGTTILVSRAKSESDARRIAYLGGQSVGIALLFGAAFALAGVLFTPSVLQTANVPYALLPIAIPYTHALAAYIPLLFLFMTFAALYDGVGASYAAWRMWIAFTLLYAALLVPFAVWFGPVGVPIAASAATLAVLAAVIRRSPVPLRVSVPLLKTMHDMLVLDLAVSAQYVGVALADLALVGIVNNFGAQAAAAFVVVSQIAAIATIPGIAFATAASAFGSESAMRGAQLANVLLSFVLILATYACARPLIGAFVHDAASAELARTGLYVMLWSVLALNAGAVVSGFVDACGQSLWPMMATLAGVWLLLVPLAHLFTRHAGAAGVWEAFPYAYVSICGMQLAYYAFARWRGYLHETAAI
jgi:Na+-driven multidrug efflux pump